MSGMCVLMLIKYISHLGGVNGTQVTINLTLRAVLSCVRTSCMLQGWWNGCGMMRLHSDYVCACLCVFVKQLFTLNSQQENQKEKKCRKRQKANKGALHYCHMVRWPKHGGHHQRHHAFVCRKTRALSHVNVLISLKLTSNGYLRFEAYNIHNNSHWFIFYQSSHTRVLICAI